ncbi:ATP-binding protein [Kitasatospora sp. NPDC002551]|uniref:ATP-binding protein n=1 Tax=Kitasatospora sp. NPDC002551 TaxID=3154539 RepID=UPI003326B0F7
MESTTSTLAAESPRHPAALPDTGPAHATADGIACTFTAVTPKTVHQARRAVTAHCRADLPAADHETEAASDLALIADELMANVQRHAPGPAVLVVTSEPGCWAVLVFDTSRQEPVPDTAEPGKKECGLGLHLVSRLSESWGSFPTASGKAVWARCPKPAPATAPQHLEQP